MLYERVIEIDERVGVNGELLMPLDELQTREALASVRESGIEALAIVLMHGWRFTDHEARLADIARELGFSQISVGHEVAPLIKLIGRGDTTVVDAYLSPVLRRYVDRVAAGLPRETDLHFMARTHPSQFPKWFADFLPRVDRREPATLFAPAIVSDRTDGKIAHLDGLNLSRAWCWRTIAPLLPPAEQEIALSAADAHMP